MKKILLLTLLVCQSVAIMAADDPNYRKVGDLWYKLMLSNDKWSAAVVAARNSETYTGLSGEITIPATIHVDETDIDVTEIGANVFQNCTNITSIVIKAAITEIFPNCFKGCTGLITINIPVTVTKINSSAFQDCSSLEVVTLPEGVTTIGSNAFNGCTGMTEVNIPESMSSIDGAAFTGCSSLTKVNFASYESLCAITFYNANSNPLNNTTAELWIGGTEQTSLMIPASITTIKQYAFAGLNSVSSVNFSKVTGNLTIAKDAFVYNSGYDKVVFTDAMQLCSMDYSNLQSNPLYFGHHIYYSNDANTEIKNVTIPQKSLDAKNKVRPYIFAGASSLERVDFPEEAIATRTGAFNNCGSLEQVGFKTIESFNIISWEGNDANPLANGKAVPLINGAFLENLTLNKDVTSDKYLNAKWLKEVTFNTGVTEIGNQAFKGCINLTTVTIEGAVITTIGDKAFHGCQKLGDFELPNSLTSIGEEAFRNCEKFTSVTIPAGCTLGDGAFVWCTQLKTATINSDIDIPSRCFQNCGNLERVITTTTRNIGKQAFENCTALTEVPVTDGLTTIGNNAFSGCKNLTNLMLSERGALATIGEGAFNSCTGVTMVSLPSSIGTINDNAFSGCTALADVYCMKDTTPVPAISPSSFGGRENEIRLHVINTNDYNDADIWKNFQIVNLAEVTLSFYINGERLKGKDITLNAGSRITTPNPEVSIKADLYKDDDIEEEFSGWDKPFPETMPSTDTRFDGYVTTTTTIDHFKYSLRPAQTINEIAYGNRAVLLGAEEGHITQSNPKVIVPETVTNTKGTYNKTEYPVVAIADNAFENQGELASVELTANITELGVSAFKGCSKLESINLSESNVTELSESVFQNCTSLSFDKIPNQITSIGKWAFSNTYCSDVTIPSTITKMGDEVFKDCKSLEKVTFADGFGLALPQMTFLSCGALKDVTLVGTMGSISNRAFEGCGSITNLVIPEGIEKIGKLAFNGCNKLANVTLPSTITQINEQAFKGCSSLSQIVVEAMEAPTTYSNAFDLKNYQDAYVYVADYTKYSTADPWENFDHLTPNTTYRLTYFVDGQQHGEIDNIRVGERIIPREKPTKDGHQFSDDWVGLPEVMPAEDVEVTGKYEYQLSYALDAESLIPGKGLPDGKLLWYGDHLELSEDLVWPSHRCSWKINDEDEWRKYEDGLPEGTTMPGNDVVIKIKYELSEKEEINGSLKYRVYLLDNKAEVIANLDENSKQIPKGNIEIPSSISIKISESPEEYKDFPVTAIQDNAFDGNQRITGMILPEGIISIGNRAFNDNRFTTFIVPASVTTIGSEAFRYCTTMETLTFADGNSMTVLSMGTFQNCSALKNAVLPSSLQRIEEGCFNNCSNLEKVTLPATLTFLGSRAFNACNKLTQITANPTTAPSVASSSNVFSSTTATLYVPTSSTGYDKAPWSSFTPGTLKEYTLTYHWDNQESTKDINVGEKIDLPTPTGEEYEGREFSGWENLPEIMPAQNVEVTGKFKYQLSYVLAEGSETPTNDLPEAEGLWYGDNIVLPASLEWAGHLCTTTYNDSPVPENFTMPANDVVITVNYQQSEQETTIDNINYKVVLLKVNSVEPHAEVIASHSKTGDVDIPASITYNTKTYPVTIINDNAFNSNNSRSITGVTLHSGLEKIGARAFRDCRFTELTIPATVKNIGNEAFLYCTTLQKVSFEADTELTELPNGTFQSCSSLGSIELPEGLTTIGVSAFAGCNALTAVKFPSTIDNIGDYAFSGSTAIETVTATSTNLPTATSTIFDNKVYENATLKVPTGTNINSLQEPWSLFDPGKVQEGEDGGSGTGKCEMPTISYDKGTLKFECDTEGATIVSDIKDEDITKDTNASPSTKALTKKYTITAYAKKSGMLWSDEVTATITWRNGKPEFENFKSVTMDDPVTKKGDIDGDDEITAQDASLILQHVAGKITIEE